jgi:HipA-like C-terminal domain.
MSKEYPLFECDIEGQFIVKIFEVIDTKHLPIVLQDNVNLESVNQWLSTRIIPNTREGIKEARKAFTFENYHNMFSLSDQYWFRFLPNEKWAKMNFFTNEYHTETGRIFFEPWTVDIKKLRKENPDLTTGGVCRKRWIQNENGTSKLIKSGSAVCGQSPVAEVLTSMLLKKLDIIPFVEYSLTVDGLQICSVCDNFIDQNTEYVPVSQIYFKEERDKKTETIYAHIVKMAERYGIPKERSDKYLQAMIAVDSLIYNTDRHLNNFGFIRNVKTGKLIDYAPLFDSGSAFFDTKENANMFKRQEKKALEKMRVNLENKDIDMQDMIHLVKTFPTISDEDKRYIVERIEKSKAKVVMILSKSFGGER